ncbi:MAG: hypothetical protein SVX43_17610 [Cyanobacteriota bacterium]|nr:hypothetical protein [Cyanobacteriota bacterium]
MSVLYRLRGNDYQKITKSEALPDLDLALLVRCVQMSDLLAARTEFLKGVRKNPE